jgi:hypothetical protein
MTTVRGCAAAAAPAAAYFRFMPEIQMMYLSGPYNYLFCATALSPLRNLTNSQKNGKQTTRVNYSEKCSERLYYHAERGGGSACANVPWGPAVALLFAGLSCASVYKNGVQLGLSFGNG